MAKAPVVRLEPVPPRPPPGRRPTGTLLQPVRRQPQQHMPWRSMRYRRSTPTSSLRPRKPATCSVVQCSRPGRPPRCGSGRVVDEADEHVRQGSSFGNASEVPIHTAVALDSTGDELDLGRLYERRRLAPTMASRDLVDRLEHLLARVAHLLFGDARQLGGSLFGDLVDMPGVGAEFVGGRFGLDRGGVRRECAATERRI